MKNREYIAPVVEGKLPNNVREAIARLLAGMEGKVVRVTITLHRARRSSSQNGYYWAVLVPAWKEIFKGYGTLADDEAVHKYLVTLGGLWEDVIGPDGDVIYSDDGQPVRDLRSTSSLTTKEFTDFIEVCRLQAATEHGFDIPPPDKFYKEGNHDG